MIIFQAQKFLREFYDIFKEGTLQGTIFYIAFKCKFKFVKFLYTKREKFKKN